MRIQFRSMNFRQKCIWFFTREKSINFVSFCSNKVLSFACYRQKSFEQINYEIKWFRLNERLTDKWIWLASREWKKNCQNVIEFFCLAAASREECCYTEIDWNFGVVLVDKWRHCHMFRPHVIVKHYQPMGLASSIENECCRCDVSKHQKQFDCVLSSAARVYVRCEQRNDSTIFHFAWNAINDMPLSKYKIH